MRHSRTLGTDFHLFLQTDNALYSSRRSMGCPPGWVLRNTWYMKLCGFLHERLITTIRCFTIRYTKGDNSIRNVSMLLTVLLMYSCFHIDNGVTNSYKEDINVTLNWRPAKTQNFMLYSNNNIKPRLFLKQYS